MTVGLNYRPKVGGSFRSLSSHGPAAVENTINEYTPAGSRFWRQANRFGRGINEHPQQFGHRHDNGSQRGSGLAGTG